MPKSNELVAWKQALTMDAKKVAIEEASGANYISLRGGNMSFKDELIPGNTLDCIVVANVTERTMYNRPFDPDDQGPPDCYAQSLDKGNLIPAENVPEPYSDKCDGCPMAEFGTAQQGKGPACKTRRKLMLMPIDGLENPAEAELAMMAIPPTSVKNFSKYAEKVSVASGLPPWGVKTRIKTQPKKTAFEVIFEPLGPVGDDKSLAAIHGLIEKAEQDLMKPYNYETESEAKEEAPKLKGQE